MDKQTDLMYLRDFNLIFVLAPDGELAWPLASAKPECWASWATICRCLRNSTCPPRYVPL